MATIDPEHKLFLPVAVMVLLITFFCTVACLQIWDIKGDKNPYVLYALLSPIYVAVGALMLALADPKKRGAKLKPKGHPVRAAVTLLFALGCIAGCAYLALTALGWTGETMQNRYIAGGMSLGLAFIAGALLTCSYNWYCGAWRR